MSLTLDRARSQSDGAKLNRSVATARHKAATQISTAGMTPAELIDHAGAVARLAEEARAAEEAVRDAGRRVVRAEYEQSIEAEMLRLCELPATDAGTDLQLDQAIATTRGQLDTQRLAALQLERRGVSAPPGWAPLP